MASAWSGVAYGLASALSWGAGDFSGGVAAKRAPVYGVVIVSQVVGLGLLAALGLVLAEPLPGLADLGWGAAAGLIGCLGMVALYQGLATGRMGLVAPTNAVVSAAVPVLFGASVEGLPALHQLGGFGLALVAVALVSRTRDGTAVRPRDLGLPALAGLAFGAFLIIIGQVSESAILWPLVAARLASVVLLSAVVVLARRRARPEARDLPLLLTAGLFDTGGNAFYALAAQAGRLDVAAVLSSLFPAVTVLLAWAILKERISGPQWLGVAAALVAVVLIAI